MTDTLPGLEQITAAFGAGFIQANKNISPYLTLRTQVAAAWYCEVTTRDQWIELMRIMADAGTPYTILGGGSNVAILSAVLKVLVIRNLYQKKEILEETATYIDLLVSSGYSVTRLAKETADAGYAGFEYHLGLPGTLGGGIYMNSKWTKPDSYLGDNLISAFLIDKRGSLKKVNHDYFDFSYGYSILQKTKEFFLEGVFRLQKEDTLTLQQRIRAAQQHRADTQPKGQFTSGCFFKNITDEQQEKLGIPTKSAGYLIDKAGLKGVSVGDFYISEKHANFIMNRGQGKPDDLHMLVHFIKEKVKEKYGIPLQEEVIILSS